ncbi:MAG: hypothetical protein RIA65_11145 [Woeseia sp.]
MRDSTFHCSARGCFGLLLAALALLAVQSPVTGADLQKVTVEFENDRYRLESRARFDVRRADLYRVLINYDLFEKFTSAFVETRNLAPDNAGRPGFFTRMEGCVLLFCKSMRRTGHLVLNPPSEIIAIAHRDSSDFNFSRERWVLQDDGDGTVMTYYFELEPAFWVPPVVGPYVIKRVLRAGGIDAVDRIEAVAQGKEPKP